MNELLKEIQEDMRRERAQKLWNSFGKLMVGASIAVVLATAVVVVWNNHKQSVAKEQTSQFIKGIDRLKLEDYKGAIATFGELTEKTSSPFYGLAMLRLAEARRLSGDKEAAQKTYEKLADKGGNNRAFAELAKVLAADNGAAIKPPEADAPFYYTQDEWHAWQLLKADKKKEAADIFLVLSEDPKAPFSLRQRASTVLQYLGAPESKPHE